MGRPVPAPAGLGDSLTVTGLEDPPPLGPIVVPTPRRLRLQSILRESRGCLAPIHRAPVPLAWSEEPGLSSLWVRSSSLPRSFFAFSLSLSLLFLFFSHSCTVWFIQ